MWAVYVPAGLLLFGVDWQLHDLAILHRVGIVRVLQAVLVATKEASHTSSKSIKSLQQAGRLGLLAQELFRFLLSRCVALEVRLVMVVNQVSTSSPPRQLLCSLLGADTAYGVAL